MIPKEWLIERLSLDEFKQLRRIDIMTLPPGYTKENVVDRDKSEWWNGSALSGYPGYNTFIENYQEGDEIWKFNMPRMMGAVAFGRGFLGGGMEGYATVRNGAIVAHFTVGA